LRTTNVLILTDDAEFARLLTACWQMERQLPGLSVVTSDLWPSRESVVPDLIVIGPLKDGKLGDALRSVPPNTGVILCAPPESQEMGALRKKYPRLVHVPLREDWTQVVLLVAGESLRRTEALRLAQQSERRATRNANQATLGRYMMDMRHNMNNAMTSLLGNAELLLLEPGELSAQSLAQIKTIHTMALRINEIMQRFSSLASEMREDETSSQAETEDADSTLFPRR
jgi:signal transduction histidine kinase